VEAEPAVLDAPGPFSRAAEAHGVTTAEIDNLLDHLPTGLLLVNRDGRAVYANEAARALRIERLEPLQWAVTRALLTEDAVREDEIEVATPGQPRRWLSANVLPVRVPGVGVTAAFVAVSDVTARSRMRAWDPVIETLVNL
jgi:PAS domain-containing protein